MHTRKKLLALPVADSGGDLHPLLAVVSRLRERGHDIVVYSTREVASALAPLGVDVVLAPPEHDFGKKLMAARENILLLPPEDRGREAGRRQAAWAAEIVPPVKHLAIAHRPEVLLTSLFGAVFTTMAAQAMGIPWAVVNSTFYVGDMRPPMEGDLTPGARVLFQDFLIPALQGASLVLHATDQKFDYNFQGLPPGHHYVGPLLWEPPGSIPAYLDEPGPPWALISLSSLPQDDLPIARRAMAALAPRPVRVLVTLGRAHDLRELDPGSANVRVERYAPHGAVLDRAVLLVSHAGHGSVIKALWKGVPMVLVPWGRDQPGVAARAEQLGVAVVVRSADLSTQTISEAVELVLGNSRYRTRAAAQARRLQAGDPSLLACKLIERL